LKKEARSLAEETSRVTITIEERKAQFAEMTSELERLTSQYAARDAAGQQLQSEINDLLYQKQLNQERISYKQKYLKRLKDLSQHRIDPSQSLQVERRLLSASQSLDNVKEIINGLKITHPHLTEVLDRVAVMTNPDLGIVGEHPQQSLMGMGADTSAQ
jgi:chromosome segregation ATPase